MTRVSETRLIFARFDGSTNGNRMAIYSCSCGNEVRLRPIKVRNGHTKSCGCIKHGYSKTPEFSSWTAMHQRCTNPAATGYSNYGGRGITICERWLQSFESFLEDMGERPSPDHQIDRKDNSGNYEPGNCEWAVPAQQARNRRSSKLTWDLVDEIRGRIEHGESMASVARRLLLTRQHVWEVWTNKIWKQESR